MPRTSRRRKRTHEEAKNLLAEYERKLAGAADQVRGMLEEARHDAEKTKQQIVAEAKTAAQAEHERAMRDIRTATDAAVEELSQRSADLADRAGRQSHQCKADARTSVRGWCRIRWRSSPPRLRARN